MIIRPSDIKADLNSVKSTKENNQIITQSDGNYKNTTH